MNKVLWALGAVAAAMAAVVVFASFSASAPEGQATATLAPAPDRYVALVRADEGEGEWAPVEEAKAERSIDEPAKPPADRGHAAGRPAAFGDSAGAPRAQALEDADAPEDEEADDEEGDGRLGAVSPFDEDGNALGERTRDAAEGAPGGTANQGIGGLGLRGDGEGGGGRGAGAINGFAQIDTGGGKGVGYRAKKRRRRLADEDAEARPRAAGPDEPVGLDGLTSKLDAARPRAEADRDAEIADGFAGADLSNARLANARFRGARTVTGEALAQPVHRPANTYTRPDTLLPRMAYFENTYLGRDAGYLKELRELSEAFPTAAPWASAALPGQPFDAPEDAGLSLSAQLSEVGVDQPQRVFLQVGLKGSERFGWRRPPLDVVLVVDRDVVIGQRRAYAEAVDSLLTTLGPLDRLAVIEAHSAPRVALPLAPLDTARAARAHLLAPGRGPIFGGDLSAGLGVAAAQLQAGEQAARVPGTGTVLILTRGGEADRVAQTARAAHGLTLQGVVTSVISTDGQGEWWRVAKAGHGNDHRGRRVADAVEAELTSLSKVIARLLRLNIRLGPNAHGVRILGSRLLSQEEKVRVKAREAATDRQISKSLGVRADRGADDDGLQTVIPFFYGGDAHVILVELWVDGPGAVADITLKYKDMVSLQNATARASVRLGAVPRAPGPAERLVAANVNGFEVGAALKAAGGLAAMGLLSDARAALRKVSAQRPADHRVVTAFADLLEAGGPPVTLGRALVLASRRRISPVPTVAWRP